ncbi:hypothetical protein HMPREF0731_0123 [Pseudoroseomonas cervicalis ATCC 49957]|uniref:Uncharacterized protein n=1 Tax=Pseudoroseomonas cervicalis ATCC 49957 TaxID=525371 RepID=D5RGB4_9PROT|nr:hypothetical protein HMPREF0731_0123 [Pseudoroseomonas cervicalis ATCC 49957]
MLWRPVAPDRQTALARSAPPDRPRSISPQRPASPGDGGSPKKKSRIASLQRPASPGNGGSPEKINGGGRPR